MRTLGEKRPDGSSFPPTSSPQSGLGPRVSQRKPNPGERSPLLPHPTPLPWRLPEPGQTGHRRLGWVRIYTPPSLPAGVPQASWGQGYSLTPRLLRNLAPSPSPSLECPKSQAKPDPWAEPAGVPMPGPRDSGLPATRPPGSTARRGGASEASSLIGSPGPWECGWDWSSGSRRTWHQPGGQSPSQQAGQHIRKTGAWALPGGRGEPHGPARLPRAGGRPGAGGSGVISSWLGPPRPGQPCCEQL